MADPEPSDPPETAEPVLVSACLLGRTCRYDGGQNLDRNLTRALEAEGRVAIPFCPEEEGGLATPRPPAWIEREGAAAVIEGRSRVVTESGRDVTEAFLDGANKALATCEARGIRIAFLKERSPSCGCRKTHVGNRVAEGPGVTAELLARAGIRVEGVEGRRA